MQKTICNGDCWQHCIARFQHSTDTSARVQIKGIPSVSLHINHPDPHLEKDAMCFTYKVSETAEDEI